MKRTRILHIIEQLGVGGAEKQLLGLSARLDPSRFEQCVIYFRRSPDSLHERFSELGLRVQHLDKDARPRVLFLPRLSLAIREFAPDVVHTWLTVANFWGRWAALAAGVRRLIASSRSEVTCSSVLVRAHERLLASRTVRLANSRAVADSLHRHCGLPVGTIEIVHNAVSLPDVDRERARREIRQELGVGPHQRLVIMLARQAREKNYPMFLRAGGLVCRQRSDVTFVGIGRQDLKAEIDEVIGALDLGDRVRFLDSKPDVHRWLAAADVFCLSSDREGCPNALLEAMAAGLPIVCTSFASARELIGADCGVLVPRSEPDRMAHSISTLLANRALADGLGRAAKERAGLAFSWEALLGRMQVLYEATSSTCLYQPRRQSHSRASGQ